MVTGSWWIKYRCTQPQLFIRGEEESSLGTHSYQQLKELCKARKDYGRGLPYFKNLFQVTFSTHTPVPHDIKNVMSCLLSPAEYMLWERTWKKHLRGLLQT